MKNYFEEIKKKLKDNLNLESIDIIDNSHLHKGHKSFNKNMYHLKLNIKSNQLN